MNIIEAMDKLRSQVFEPHEINGETILIPTEGYISRSCCDAVIDIECDINGVPYISFYRSLPPEIEKITTWGVGGNMSINDEWLVINETNELRCEDITATDWEFTLYPPDEEHEPDPDKDVIWCRYNCPGMGKDGCKVWKDYLPKNKSAINVSCPYPKNKELIQFGKKKYNEH